MLQLTGKQIPEYGKIEEQIEKYFLEQFEAVIICEIRINGDRELDLNENEQDKEEPSPLSVLPDKNLSGKIIKIADALSSTGDVIIEGE
ncbi:MAG TPA: hypothetical protein VFF25_02885, partial [Clostridia bacterium]|nr:hypothetical protein [Clostridia bacterium]